MNAAATVQPGDISSPTLHELEHTPPRVALRVTLFVLLLLVLVLLLWSLVAHLDIVASAPGKLVPATQVKTVQAAEAGIVREILVRDGDRVDADQALLRLDPTLATADAEQIANDLQLKRLTVRAIDAELAGRSLTGLKGDAAHSWVQVRAQFDARRSAVEQAVAQEREAANRARHERLAAVRQRDKLRQTLPLYQQAAESFARLFNDGFIGELAANDRRREAIEREQDLSAQEATIEAFGAALAQSEHRLQQLQSSYRADLLRERGEAQAAMQRLEQEQAKSGFRSRQLVVLAPQAGVVKDLVVRAAGFVVQPGAALLRIVPDGEPLIAEAMLANEDVGFVEVGQRARIKLATYPFQKYGVLEGRVTQISADALDPADAPRVPGAPWLGYRAVVELASRQLVAPDGRGLELAAGMAAMIEIHQGRRTVMEFLLSPVQRLTAEAGRER